MIISIKLFVRLVLLLSFITPNISLLIHRRRGCPRSKLFCSRCETAAPGGFPCGHRSCICFSSLDSKPPKYLKPQKNRCYNLGKLPAYTNKRSIVCVFSTRNGKIRTLMKKEPVQIVPFIVVLFSSMFSCAPIPRGALGRVCCE